MRKLTLLSILLFFHFTLPSQEDCGSLLSYTAEQQWVHQWYSANKKPSFTSYSKVIKPLSNDSSQVSILLINAYKDTVYQGNYWVQCTENGLFQDLLSKLTPAMLQSLDGLELTTSGNGWILPIGLTAGDSIPQSYSHLSGYDNGAKIVDLDIAIGPVHIFKQENLNTPAGGFPCISMSYELWITQITRKRFKLRDWFAPGVGIIRREIFNLKGQFFGYCELMEYSSPQG